MLAVKSTFTLCYNKYACIKTLHTLFETNFDLFTGFLGADIYSKIAE